MAYFLSDVFDSLGFNQTDGEAAQAGDVLGAMAGADAAAVLIVVPIEDVMTAIFDRPVATVDFEQAPSIGLFGGTAGDAIGHLAGGLTGFFINRGPFNGEDLADMGEIHIIVEFGTGPDFTGFDAAMVGRVVGDTLRGRSILEQKGDVVKEGDLIGFDGEVVVGVALSNQVVGEFSLGEERIGADVFAVEIEPLEQRDGHADFVGLLYGLRISLARDRADFFWV